jgi:hypothetical protein
LPSAFVLTATFEDEAREVTPLGVPFLPEAVFFPLLAGALTVFLADEPGVFGIKLTYPR